MSRIDWTTVFGVIILIGMLGYLAFIVGYDSHKQQYENDIERRYEKQKAN